MVVGLPRYIYIYIYIYTIYTVRYIYYKVLPNQKNKDNMFFKKNLQPLQGTWTHVVVAMLIGWLMFEIIGSWVKACDVLFVLDVNFVGQKWTKTWGKLRLFFSCDVNFFLVNFWGGNLLLHLASAFSLPIWVVALVGLQMTRVDLQAVPISWKPYV